MNLLTKPLFYLLAFIFFIIVYFLVKKYADKKIGDNPYLNDPKIKEVINNPKLFKEKISNLMITNSEGNEVKINRILDNGKELQF